MSNRRRKQPGLGKTDEVTNDRKNTMQVRRRIQRQGPQWRYPYRLPNLPFSRHSHMGAGVDFCFAPMGTILAENVRSYPIYGRPIRVAFAGNEKQMEAATRSL
jgi:hypothetical protein